jgi:hypothetical protein
MATKIILTVDDGLTEEEIKDLTFLLSDALHDFAALRTPAIAYVRKRYPDQKLNFDGEGKIMQVERRTWLAQKLHNAALAFEIETVK